MKRNRLLLLAAAAAVAVVTVVVLVVVAGGGGSGGATTTTAKSAPSAALAGISQNGDTLGSAGAPATLVVYEDPQCPFCRRWNLETLPTVLDDYVRPGKLKLVYRGVVIIGPDSVRGLRAIYAAADQNKLWNLVDALYRHQGQENSGWITTSVIRTAAREAGANVDAILTRTSTPAVTAALTRSAKQAQADQVPGTPTFVVERPPAVARRLTLTGLDPASFEAALDAALQR